MTALEIARNYFEMKVDENPDHWVDVVLEIAKVDKLDEVAKALSDIQKGEAK